MSFTVIIPARADSSRLPGKALLDLAGLPMVVRTALQAGKSQAQQVVVATDHAAIASACKLHGIKALMTRNDHPSGTDRIAEAAAQLSLLERQIIVNVQGDEPMIEPQLINAVADLLARHPQAAMATCATAITQAAELFNPNVVKLVCDASGKAMYFSRAPIPWARDALADGQQRLAPGLPAWHHLGLYAYTASFLQIFPGLQTGQLEQLESLEQLRALEHGYEILVHKTNLSPIHGVDTPQDLERVRAVLSGQSG